MMFELATRLQRVDEEIASLRGALQRLREIFAEGDRLQAQRAARPKPLVLVSPSPPAPRPSALPDQIVQALYNDNFVFQPRPVPAARPKVS